MSSTAKLILIIVIIIAVVILLIKFLPKANAATPPSSGTGDSGTGGSGGSGSSGTGNKNYDASTWKVGDMIYASKDTPAVCVDCLLPDWLLTYHFPAGNNMGTFLSFSGSTVTSSSDGYTYTTLIRDRPYTIRS